MLDFQYTLQKFWSTHGRSMCNVTDLSHAMVIILQCGDAVIVIILHIKHIPQDAMSYLMTGLMEENDETRPR